MGWDGRLATIQVGWEVDNDEENDKKDNELW